VQQDFQERLQRLGAAKQEASPRVQRAETKNGSPVGWLLGGLQGFLTLAALVFTTANYDRFVTDAQEFPQLGLVLFGLLGFLGLSLIVFAFGVLRRLLSARARQKGWGPVLGFLAGLTVATVAMGVAGS
jgi:hypothetical protein